MGTTDETLPARRIWPDEPLRTRRANAPWYEKYRFAIFVTDLAMIVVALLTAQYTKFGASEGVVTVGPQVFSYEAVGVAVELIWVFSLTVTESRSKRVVGSGLEEYRRVLNGTLLAFGIVAIASYLFKIELSRFYFVTAMPIGLVLLLLGRMLWRMYLSSVRRNGRAATGTVLVGERDEVLTALKDMRRQPQSGYKPVAVAIVGPDSGPENDPLLQGLPRVERDELAGIARDPRLGAVMIAGGISRREVRDLAWDLENSSVELILVSRLTDVAGPRMHVSPVDGLPMVHVDLPQYTGFNFVAKRSMDILFAAAVLVALAPVFALVALAIKLDDRGPVIFRQERIGQYGKPFTIHKFRTMAIDAEARIADLIAKQGGTALLFKMKNDPRITRVGHFLRKYSIDELPQFWDVLMGTMSVVGPRPQVLREVEQYEQHVHRRLLTKPGITGLWQVSGRSELSIEESVRLDLRYVENWSISGDIVLILKTIRAVLRPDGAY
ncbi:sugar transferase [Georgenia daeguensis]|uniref:Sugar transferase n=1 Tax=Georgenia daeguensis TaxID=908355 RepID=A0ABP8EVL8_9MICO